MESKFGINLHLHHCHFLRGLWSIIMPSSHHPNGDGVIWPQLQSSGQGSESAVGNDKAAFMA